MAEGRESVSGDSDGVCRGGGGGGLDCVGEGEFGVGEVVEGEEEVGTCEGLGNEGC